jgi:small basic protein (TIGR04137 family)
MSIDRSLRLKSSLERHRNVLSRAERVALLRDQERWTAERSVLALPKIAHRKGKAAKKKVKAETAEAAAEAGATAAATPAEGAAKPGAAKAGAAGKPAAAAKPAKPG